MIDTSQHTVVALFEDERSAQAAAEELTRSGFSPQVHSSGSQAGHVGSGGAGLSGRAPGEHEGGGFMSWLSSIFGGDDEAQTDSSHYSQAVQRGGYVVAVDTDENDRDRAIDILERHGVVDIDEHAAKHGYAASQPTRALAQESNAVGQQSNAVGQESNAIPVIEEQLRVGKRSVQRGGVRVYSRVIEQPVEQDIQLREEKATVERRPVDRPLTDADRSALRDQTIEVTEMAEEAVIDKQARVVEEVRVGKQATERTQKVRDTVRRTEVTTEDIGANQGGSQQGSRFADDFRSDFETRYGASGAQYETYAPAYEFGHRMSGDPRYQGRSWSEIEPTLQTEYARANPNSTWEQVKGAVQHGWEKVTGQR